MFRINLALSDALGKCNVWNYRPGTGFHMLAASPIFESEIALAQVGIGIKSQVWW